MMVGTLWLWRILLALLPPISLAWGLPLYDVPGPTTLISPTGINVTLPTYRWEEVSSATWYKLHVEGLSGVVIEEWYQASDVCTEGMCAITPDVSLDDGPYTWWMQTWNSDGYGPWSASLSFVVVHGLIALTSGNLWALRREISYGDAAIVVLLVVLVGVRLLTWLVEGV